MYTTAGTPRPPSWALSVQSCSDFFMTIQLGPSYSQRQLQPMKPWRQPERLKQPFLNAGISLTLTSQMFSPQVAKMMKPTALQHGQRNLEVNALSSLLWPLTRTWERAMGSWLWDPFWSFVQSGCQNFSTCWPGVCLSSWKSSKVRTSSMSPMQVGWLSRRKFHSCCNTPSCSAKMVPSICSWNGSRRCRQWQSLKLCNRAWTVALHWPQLQLGQSFNGHVGMITHPNWNHKQVSSVSVSQSRFNNCFVEDSRLAARWCDMKLPFFRMHWHGMIVFFADPCK